MQAIEVPGEPLAFPATCVNCGAPGERTIRLNAGGFQIMSRKANVKGIPICGGCARHYRRYMLIMALVNLLDLVIFVAATFLLRARADFRNPMLASLVIALVALALMTFIANTLVRRFAPDMDRARNAAVLLPSVVETGTKRRVIPSRGYARWLVIREDGWAAQVEGGGQRIDMGQPGE